MSPAPVHHHLEVRLDVEARRLDAVDALDLSALPPTDGGWPFVLHADLSPEVRTAGWRLVPGPPIDGPVPLASYTLEPTRKRPRFPVELSFGGTIDHRPQQVATEHQRSFSESPGLIGPEGVFLSGASRWVPTFGQALVSFELTVTGLERPWDAVSQGERVLHDAETTAWRAADPMEEVYLVAGPWTERSRSVSGAEGPVEVLALLRSDEPELAERYLGATGRYLSMYEAMLGPYPYPSFALVENFWETGYGMPGFTLLGPQVIRFPWILSSSYPHELLHNWWGNSAYVDGERGNWCEGLTSYLADHLFAEQRGEGAAHRRATLQKYADLVTTDQDFPLTAFGSRSSAGSEAVGYGKSAMVFHMVRRRVGDQAFLRILRRFYAEARFRRASYRDFAAAVSAETGEDWGPWFEAWTGRIGAPTLSLVEASVQPVDGRFALTVRVRQDGGPFPLRVPVAVTTDGGQPTVEILPLEGAEGAGTWIYDRPPTRIDLDPQFDLMRRLDPLEVPPAVSTLLGSESVTFVLPSRASEEERQAWTALATGWSGDRPPRLVGDEGPLPPGDVWVLGWANRHARAVAALAGDSGPEPGRSLAAVVRSPDDPSAAVGLLAADPLEAIGGLARKIPHYGRYALLAFAGPEPTNTEKGLARPTPSPSTRGLGGGPLPPLTLPEAPPLAALPPE